MVNSSSDTRYLEQVILMLILLMNILTSFTFILPVIIPQGLLLVAHEPSFHSTSPGTHIRGETLRAYSIGGREVDLLLPGTAR